MEETELKYKIFLISPGSFKGVFDSWRRPIMESNKSGFRSAGMTDEKKTVVGLPALNDCLEFRANERLRSLGIITLGDIIFTAIEVLLRFFVKISPNTGTIHDFEQY